MESSGLGPRCPWGLPPHRRGRARQAQGRKLLSGGGGASSSSSRRDFWKGADGRARGAARPARGLGGSFQA